VTHHVEGACFPNWEGTDQQRFFELSDDRLYITTAPIPALGTEWVVSLIWDRVL
ncbi:MAG: lipocalin-like domain-containing protein, partial [Deltaproteobacteria bacterium]|nr:lipocalin-like domain-containing protein [Deltaproteobacteria bacterium]